MIPDFILIYKKVLKTCGYYKVKKYRPSTAGTSMKACVDNYSIISFLMSPFPFLTKYTPDERSEILIEDTL